MARYRSTLRIDTRTGQVESAVVEAVDANGYDADHDADHVRASAEFGRLLDPQPEIDEIQDGDGRAGPATPTGLVRPTPEPDDETENPPEVVEE